MVKKSFTIYLLFFCNNIFASDFGTTGIIDVPSARMLNDGELSTTLSFQKIANITNITYQATPWLQTTFRYTIFNPDNPSRNSIGIDGVNDRSYSAKLTLLNEGRYKPELALGIKDLLGTGIWGSEYLVATKKINNFDVTLGAGWGRLSDNNSFKNPLISLNDSYEYRNNSNRDVGGALGGKLRGGSFFKGQNIGIFGGIEYKIPNSNLNFLLEYNSDQYKREISRGTIDDSSPISYGLRWSGLKQVDFSLSYQQGNQVGLSISSKLNTKIIQKIPSIDPFYSSIDGYSLSAAPKTLNLESWYDRLLHDLDRSGILLRAAKINESTNNAIIEISNYRYILIADALNRVLTLSQIHLPKHINTIDVIINENGHRLLTLSYQRISNQNLSYLDDTSSRFKILSSRSIKNPTNITKLTAPKTTFDVNLSSRFQLFDPDKPAKYQLYLKTSAIVNLSNDWNIFATYAHDIDNNFDLNRSSNSSLNRVRTEINRYLVEGSSGIENLYMEKRSNISNNIVYRLYAGILETMYSGVGFELLYQPYMSRLAFGSTVNKLRKRDYKRNFDLLNYETVTGFVSIFYASPFYNYDFAIHVGKYLAKDKGATVEIRRTFDNGFSVGAFATLTNVSAEDFGEGSFDKGLYFKIPFASFSNRNTKSSFSTIIRSVQRDGGQRLEDYSGRLWFDMRNTRYDVINNNNHRMVPL